MKKALLVTLVVIVTLVLALVIAKDVIIKTSIEKGVELVTGLKLTMQTMKVGIIKQVVDIKGLNLHNPESFKDRTMIDMPSIYVDYDLGAIFQNKIHMQNMKIDLKEFYVIKNEKGELNIDSLKVVQAQKEGKKAQEKKAPQIQIDTLELKIGKVIYKDYSKGATPMVQEFDINLNEKYTNITSPYTLVSLIVVKALYNTTIGRLANINLDELKNSVSDTLSSAQKTTAEAVKGATDTLKKTTEELKKGIKFPFGGK